MAIHHKIIIMHVIDLSYFVKHIVQKISTSLSILRHFHRAGDLHLSGTTRCIYEDVIMKKCLTLLIATVLSGISHGLCRATDE